MENSQGLSILAKCEECGQTFQVNNEMLKNKNIQNLGQSMRVTYYDCPCCVKRHFVQIDNEESLQMLERNKIMFIKLSVRKRKGKPISKKQSDKFSKARKDLSDYRMNLMKQFNDKTVIDKDEDTIIKLRFSI